MQLSRHHVHAINRRNRSNVYCFAKSMIINYHFCQGSFVSVIREYVRVRRTFKEKC